jgi:hypothetical protein
VVLGKPVVVLHKSGAGVLRVYFEGDGQAYVTRNLPSPDPTPAQPTGLQLALADATPQPVVYVGRPCMWMMDLGARETCFGQTQLWTTERFTEQVAVDYAALVEKLSAGGPVELVGYSGGGWIATQVAARLANVQRLVTVAGNVAPNWVNAQHKVTPMVVAPYPALEHLRTVPQVHVSGGADKIVRPGAVAAYWVEIGGMGVQPELVVPGQGHSEGLVARWPGLLPEVFPSR